MDWDKPVLQTHMIQHERWRPQKHHFHLHPTKTTMLAKKHRLSGLAILWRQFTTLRERPIKRSMIFITFERLARIASNLPFGILTEPTCDSQEKEFSTWGRGSGGVKSAGISQSVRETGRDESQSVPSQQNSSKKGIWSSQIFRALSQVVRCTPRDTPVPLCTRTSPPSGPIEVDRCLAAKITAITSRQK